ncbi:MAG: hypothetical protein K9L57_06060 [Spirochaetaceae bacterium]|nr:hypothetical protein [Spirochaetaceae bacterium]
MFNIIKRNRKRDADSIIDAMRQKGFADFRGEVEVIGRDRFGKINYYDFGENTVTVWAKHMTMHLLTGENFSSHGEQRIFDSEDGTAHTNTGAGEGTNKDGTLLSGEQYFSTNDTPDFSLDSRWSKSTVDAQIGKGDSSDTDSEMKYPFFPTKMLFGTGFEFQNWGSIPSDYQTYYSDLGWDQSTFNDNIGINDNWYNVQWDGGSLTKARSMNDIYSGALTTPTIQDTDYAIPGSIKTGTYYDSSIQRGDTGSGTQVTYFDGGNEYLKKTYAGIGTPAFIYANREARYFESGSEILLSNDSYLENKITFTAVMPEQTGDQAGIYYPYNSYLLKVAGLFADAHMLLGNTIPSGSSDDHEDELEYYDKMPGGIMAAKRYLSPVFKSHDTSLSIRWTIYL